MTTDPGAAGRRADGIWRGVLVLFLAGVTIGIAFNALGRAGRPPRGLDWIASQRTLPTLDDLRSSAPEGPSRSSGAAPAAEVAKTAPATSAPAAVPRPAGPATTDDPPSASGQPSPPEPAPPGRAKAAERGSGAGPARTTGKVSTASSAANLPEIPDLPQPVQIQLPMVKSFFDAKAALFVDAREKEEFSAGHIPGAINLPFDESVTDPDRLAKVDSGGRPIITYCGGGTCEVSMNLAFALRDAGKHRLLVFMGGFPEWESAGYPVQKDAGGGTR